MRVELLCEIFIHTKELPILVSLHYVMDLYIGIDVKIVKYYYLKRHEGNQSLYYLMQHMYKHEIQKKQKIGRQKRPIQQSQYHAANAIDN